jgi:hypothetical protein
VCIGQGKLMSDCPLESLPIRGGVITSSQPFTSSKTRLHFETSRSLEKYWLRWRRPAAVHPTGVLVVMIPVHFLLREKLTWTRTHAWNLIFLCRSVSLRHAILEKQDATDRQTSGYLAVIFIDYCNTFTVHIQNASCLML